MTTLGDGTESMELDEQVTSIVQAAEADAERIRAQAQEEAAAIRRRAEVEAARLRREARMLGVALERRGGVEKRRVRRLDPVAVFAVMSRELIVFLRSWRSTTFSAVVEPTVFLFGFGFGFGAIVSQVSGVDYIQFVGTGVVAVTVVFGSAFPAMFNTLVKRRFQRVYDSLLSTPVDVNELVTAEILWLALRAGVFSMAPVGVAIAFGLRPHWEIALVPGIAFLTGLGFAAFGVIISASVSSFDKFNYVISAVLTPLLLAAGVYFPIDQLPDWGFVAAQLNPLYHCVELVRHAAFGPLLSASDLAHVLVLVGFALLMWRVAIWRLRPALID
jgi:lipooligosaccharide transport system permease protein